MELLRTRCLNKKRSFCVNVSALAMTGIRLTRVPRRFMISMSSGFRLSFIAVNAKELQRTLEDIRVTCRADEVEAGVNSKVRLFVPLRLLLLTHICLMLVINKLDDRHPRVAVVDVVTEARCVNNGELDLELLLFKFGLDYFNFG